jgi:hypothetical protein
MRSVQKEGGDEAIRDDYSLHPHAPCWPLKWPRTLDRGPAAMNVVPVADNAVPMHPLVAINVVPNRALIAVLTVFDCEPVRLQLEA